MSERPWKLVLDVHNGGFHPELAAGEVYEFRRNNDDQIHSFRLSDQSPFFNIAGLEWREREAKK